MNLNSSTHNTNFTSTSSSNDGSYFPTEAYAMIAGFTVFIVLVIFALIIGRAKANNLKAFITSA
jgi:hypothetical protein